MNALINSTRMIVRNERIVVTKHLYGLQRSIKDVLYLRFLSIFLEVYQKTLSIEK